VLRVRLNFFFAKFRQPASAILVLVFDFFGRLLQTGLHSRLVFLVVEYRVDFALNGVQDRVFSRFDSIQDAVVLVLWRGMALLFDLWVDGRVGTDFKWVYVCFFLIADGLFHFA